MSTSDHRTPADEQKQNSLTSGPCDPLSLGDVNVLVDTLAHLGHERERLPERLIHAKGAGAHGYFQVTHDVTNLSKAQVFNKVGKRTPVFVRFSTVGGERGSSELVRDPRGFAIKHYTEDGIWDMVGLNSPIFFIREPTKVFEFVSTQKRRPDSNLVDADAVWNFASSHPESVHQFSFLFSDRGIPASYRHMDGFSSHTYKWVNASGVGHWIKLHYKTCSGIKNLTNEEAIKLGDADHATRDLFNHLAQGNQATWNVYYQCMTIDEAKTKPFNVFDITKIWPHADYPLQPLGKLVLNRNPQNYMAEVEQAVFSPAHLVPGIEPSLDRVLQARLVAYPHIHRHRLGSNYLQIPINCPYAGRLSNQQGGDIAVPHKPGVSSEGAISRDHVDDGVASAHNQQTNPDNDFEQCGIFFCKVLTEAERARLVSNIVGSLKHASKPVQARMVDVFTKVDKDYGQRVAQGLAEAQAGTL